MGSFDDCQKHAVKRSISPRKRCILLACVILPASILAVLRTLSLGHVNVKKVSYERWDSSRHLFRCGPPLHSFLEGPSFDRDGNLYCVDVCRGRLFKISPDGRWQVFASYAGNPNGLKIHRDGRIFVADHHLGLLCFDPLTRARSLVADRAGVSRFRGLNALVFGDDGDLFFTDPGESALENPNGRVFRMRADGTIELLTDGLPYPNGLVLSPSQKTLYVAVTRSQQVLRLPLHARGAFKCGMFPTVRRAGRPRWHGDRRGWKPGGRACGVRNGLGFDTLGEPVVRIRSCAGVRTTNVAFGGPDNKSLFITEAEHGVILHARLDFAGRPMYSYQ
jgi:gluconolactonase